MGAWGEKAFQNESALDWLAEFEAGGVATLRNTLRTVAETDEHDDLDVDDGTSAIAGAEIVAAALGRGRDRVPIAVSAWLDRNHGCLVAEDLGLAKRAVERALAARSELRALWDDDGPDNAWHKDVGVLLSRLLGDAGAEGSNPPTTNTRSETSRAPTGERDKQVIVTFLRARGLNPTAKELARIQASHDISEIRRWLARAIDATSVASVLNN